MSVGIFDDVIARELDRIRESPEFKAYVEMRFPKYPNLIPPSQPPPRRWARR